MIASWTLDTYLYFEIIRRAGPVFTSQANYIMLVSGVLCGAVFFSEHPAPTFWVSFGFVMAALALLSWQRLQASRRNNRAEAEGFHNAGS